MKLSVSLSEEDVAFIDDYARRNRISTRSGVFQRAVQMLRASQLGDAYERAWEEWEDSGDAQTWEAAADDGVER